MPHTMTSSARVCTSAIPLQQTTGFGRWPVRKLLADLRKAEAFSVAHSILQFVLHGLAGCVQRYHLQQKEEQKWRH